MRYLLLSLLALLLGLAPMGDVYAKPKKPHSGNPQPAPTGLTLRPVVLNYEIYVGGLHLVTSRFLMEEGGGRYRIQGVATANGVWRKVFPWEARMEAQGGTEGPRLRPVTSTLTETWRGKVKSIHLNFDREHVVTAAFEPPQEDTGHKPVPLELRRNALDPLSTALQLINDVEANKSCATTAPVFEGKRRFDVRGTDKGVGETDPDTYGIYKGPARRCDLSFTMVAGERKRERDKGFWQNSREARRDREPFQIWMANFAPDLPALPVRAESRTVWGIFVAHLAGWRYAEPGERVE